MQGQRTAPPRREKSLSGIAMPQPDAGILARLPQIVAALRDVLPEDAVIWDPEETRAYECDALTAYRCPPLAVVLPRTTEEVAAAMRICHEMRVPVVPRGAGTSLAGGRCPPRTASSSPPCGCARCWRSTPRTASSACRPA